MVALRKENHQHPDYRQQALDLIEYATHRTHIITFPTAFLGLLDNQHDAAILLNQILYWSSRTSNPDGWFYKSYEDWFTEIGLTRYKVQKALYGDNRSTLERMTLYELGVETQVRKAPTGNPTVHYRIDMPLFLAQLEAYLGADDDAPLCNTVAEGNATESPNETQQCDTSSSYKEFPTKEYHPENQCDERLLTLLTTHENSFGKLAQLSNETQIALLQQIDRLGTQLTLNVVERCTAYGKSWHYVLTALKNESSAEISQKSPSWMEDISPEDIFTPYEPLVTDDGQPFRSMQAIMEASRQKQLARKPEMYISERIHTEWTNPLFPERAYAITQIWEMVADQLKLQFGSDFNQGCLRHLSLVDFEPDTPCFVLVSDAESTFWYTIRCERNFTRLMSDLMGVDTTFRVVKKAEWLQLPEHE